MNPTALPHCAPYRSFAWAALLAVVLGLGLSGCGGGGGGGTTSAPSNPPVANAGAAQTVATKSVVALDGGASVDPNGNTLSYSWLFTSKPDGSTAILSNVSGKTPTFTADVDGSYIISLVVTSEKIVSSPSVVSIIALPTLFTADAKFNSLNGNSGLWDLPTRKVSVLKTGIDWGVNLTYQSIKLTAGKIYYLSLICSNLSSSSYAIKIQPKDGHISFYALENVKCDGQTKSVRFVSPVTDPAAVISLNFGMAAGNYVVGNSITVTPSDSNPVSLPTVPDGAIWLQQAIEQDTPPQAYSSVLIWAVATTLSPTQSTSETAEILINYWKVYENLPDGSSRVIFEEHYNTINSNFTKGGLFARIPKWFVASANNASTQAFNIKAESGNLVVNASQSPSNMIHWWTDRLSLTPAATYSAEIQFKVTGKTAIIFGSDWWRNLTAPAIDFQWDCTLTNTCEAWVSDWYGDTDGKFITVKVPNR
jgi:hypothetical protein